MKRDRFRLTLLSLAIAGALIFRGILFSDDVLVYADTEDVFKVRKEDEQPLVIRVLCSFENLSGLSVYKNKCDQEVPTESAEQILARSNKHLSKQTGELSEAEIQPLALSGSNDSDLMLLYQRLQDLKRKLQSLSSTLNNSSVSVSGGSTYLLEKRIEEFEERFDRQLDAINDSGDAPNLNEYLKKTGGALTGGINGTTASFSGALTVGGATSLNGVSYSWPSSDGTSGQFLSTDGSGTLTWETASGGFSGGELVASHITATSSSATSTFAGHVSIATGKEYRINGSGVLSRPGVSNVPLLIGNLTGNSRGSNAIDIQSNRDSATQVASGNGSLAIGQETIASGDYSIAIGYTSDSGGSYGSLAVGIRSTAQGYGSVALGKSSQSYANYSTTIGYQNYVGEQGNPVFTSESHHSTASGYLNSLFSSENSLAIGYLNINNNSPNSLSAGYSNAVGSFSVNAPNSSAVGYSNSVQASDASAFGNSITNNIDDSTMIGPSDSAKLTILSTGEARAPFFSATSSSATSTFAGHVSIATGKEYRINGSGVLTKVGGAFIAGDLTGNARGTKSLDLQSFRTNSAQVASGLISIAVGYSNTASDSFSTGIGYENVASENYASAIGSNNSASGYYGTAVGSHNTVSGYWGSTGAGYQNTVSGSYSSAFGSYNNASADRTSIFGSSITNNIANSTMIGPSDSAKLTVLGAAGSVGFTGIGTSTPQYALHVVRSTDGDVAGFTDSNGTCTINPTTTSLVCSSDERLKKDIESIEGTDALSIVTGLNPVTFRWKNQDSSVSRYGFIAQEVEGLLPEIISEQENGYKSISYSSLTPVAIGAIKELDIELSDLEKRAEKLLGVKEKPRSLATILGLMFKDAGAVIADGVARFRRVTVSEEICIDDTCIDEDGLRLLLESANINKSKKSPILNPEALEPSIESDDDGLSMEEDKELDAGSNIDSASSTPEEESTSETDQQSATSTQDSTEKTSTGPVLEESKKDSTKTEEADNTDEDQVPTVATSTTTTNSD